MGRTMSVEDSVVIAADAHTIYAQLADPAQMARWSPENQGLAGPSRGTLGVGESFVGRNRRGRFEWVTSCTVVAANPGQRFAFEVHGWGRHTPRPISTFATWEYVLEDVPRNQTPSDRTMSIGTPYGATRVTERWTDGRTRWPDWLAAGFDKTATRGSLFADFQRRNIARTLANLKADFEKVA